MRYFIKRGGKQYKLSGELLDSARKAFLPTEQALKLLIAFDLGVTGVTFKINANTEMTICNSFQHITDVNGQPGYGLLQY
jgi:hypothetical protein